MTLLYIHIEDFGKKYQKLLYKYIKKTATMARRHVQETTQLQRKKQLSTKKAQPTIRQPLQYLSYKAKQAYNIINNDTGRLYKIQENKSVTRQLRDETRNTSKYVTNNMAKRVNEILSTSETEGIGHKQVAKKLQKEFKQLKGYKARRIARTEINAANNKVTHTELLKDDLVEYKQWITCEDDRVRITHRDLDGEITRIGDPFSNGLQYPGDHSGSVKEFINCRCTLAGYFIDWDKTAPDKPQFHESDLIPLPENKQQRIEIQVEETDKVFEAKRGYLDFTTEIKVKPSKPSIPTRVTTKPSTPTVEPSRPTPTATSKPATPTPADTTKIIPKVTKIDESKILPFMKEHMRPNKEIYPTTLENGQKIHRIGFTKLKLDKKDIRYYDLARALVDYVNPSANYKQGYIQNDWDELMMIIKYLLSRREFREALFRAGVLVNGVLKGDPKTLTQLAMEEFAKSIKEREELDKVLREWKR